MKEGTFLFTIQPPHPWPVGRQTFMGDMHAPDIHVALYTGPEGRIEIRLTDAPKPTESLFTVPLTFTETGAFRLAVAWSDEKGTVVFAGGECVASTDLATPAITAHRNIELKETFESLPDHLEPAWESKASLPGHASGKELVNAQAALTRLQNAQCFDEYERAWLDCIGALERCWIKLEREFTGHSRFQPWQGRFTKFRREDPLISYVRFARNADAHSLQEIVCHVPGQITLTSTGSTHIRGMTLVNGHLTLDASGSDVAANTTPPRVDLRTIVDSGTAYPPPRSHLGQDIHDPTPHNIAALAIEFYSRMLDEAKLKFT